jgi:hypothetical protein
MKRFRAAFISLAVLTNVGIGVATAVAQIGGAPALKPGSEVPPTTHCTVASVKGDFGFAGQGFLARAPLAFVGVLHFDGKGHFSGHHEESIGGNYGPSVEAGDYSVSDDCMGITHWTDHPPHTGLPPHNHTIVFNVHSGGAQGNFLGIDNSPPGQFHNEIPEPDIEFWGTMNRL